MNVLSKTQNGQIFLCNACQLYHVEYKNLSFNFTEEQLSNFKQYLQNLNGDQLELQNDFLPYQRKIVIPIGHESFTILIDKNELNELVQLFVNINQGSLSEAFQTNLLSDKVYYKDWIIKDLSFTQFFN